MGILEGEIREREWELEDGTRYRSRRPVDDWSPPTAWCWRYVDEDIWHLVKPAVAPEPSGKQTGPSLATVPDRPAQSTGDAKVALTRACPFDGCGLPVPPERFCCPRHWRSLSQRRKAAVWACCEEWQASKLTGDELRARQRAVLDQAQGIN